MKAKKILSALFCLALAALLVSCASTDTASDTKDGTTADAPTTNGSTDNDTDNKTDIGGNIMINDVTAWVGYPASDFYVKTDEGNLGVLTYSYDKEALLIDEQARTVKALKKGKFTVTVSSGSSSSTFTVNAQTVNKSIVGENGTVKYDTSRFTAKAQNRLSQWQSSGVKDSTTIFIGDSFFDTDFWSNFYSVHYGGKDALLLGISATTTYDWETWANSWLGETSPKNIVIHIGTNNVYDDGDNDATATSALMRLFTVLHDKFPSTNIYWYGITYRSFNQTKINYTKSINATMQKWCAERSYITYMDTPALITTDMLKDGTHPKLENYGVFTGALSKTDVVIANKSTVGASKINDVSFSTSQMIKDGTGSSTVFYRGEALSRNYVLKGKLDITKFTTNSHVNFTVFGGGTDRILLWDNQSIGKFKLAIPYNTTDVPAEDIYTLTAGGKLTLEWELVVTDNDAYFFIGGELKLVYVGFNSQNVLAIGSEATECRFYDMTAITKSADEGEYQKRLNEMSDIIARYDNSATAQKFRA